MKAFVEEVNTVQRRIKVELSALDVKTAFDSVYRNLQKKARINGFRPGKAPINVIRKMYGPSVAYDVADQLVRNHLFTAIEQQSIRPIATPVLETSDLPKEDADYAFSALVDILPALKISGYKDLQLECTTAAFGPADIQRELDMIQRRHAKTQDAPEGTKASSNHIVTISQKAHIDGELFTEFTFESVPVELGKKFLLPELEEALPGLVVGAEKHLKITVPDHVNDKSKIGKVAECTVKLEKIVELQMPELNDELAKDLGLDSFEVLTSNIKDRLQKQAEATKRNQLESEIFDKLSSNNSFEVPPSMVDQVIDSMFDEMEFDSDAQRKSAKADENERKGLRDSAKQRTKNTLMLTEIIKSESITVNDDDFDAYVKELVGGANASKELDSKLIDSIKASMGPHARESLLFKKALDFVIDHAKVTEKVAALNS
ncbi:MAG: trigger factor [Proteobacteria bacterium]|nr:trigger factor [Pseudomonadota bacterium]